MSLPGLLNKIKNIPARKKTLPRAFLLKSHNMPLINGFYPSYPCLRARAA
jgi:hypothetical protein